MTHEYITALLKAYPSIREVWLIGSRANGTQKDTSDWDYLVFADKTILQCLSQNTVLNVHNIDLLIVYDEDNFKKPWLENGKEKSGSLKGWGWNKTSDTHATYTATKLRQEDGFYVDCTIKKAQRIK